MHCSLVVKNVLFRIAWRKRNGSKHYCKQISDTSLLYLLFGLYYLYGSGPVECTTHKRLSNWPPSFCYILGNVFGEKYK